MLLTLPCTTNNFDPQLSDGYASGQESVGMPGKDGTADVRFKSLKSPQAENFSRLVLVFSSKFNKFADHPYQRHSTSGGELTSHTSSMTALSPASTLRTHSIIPCADVISTSSTEEASSSLWTHLASIFVCFLRLKPVWFCEERLLGSVTLTLIRESLETGTWPLTIRLLNPVSLVFLTVMICSKYVVDDLVDRTDFPAALFFLLCGWYVTRMAGSTPREHVKLSCGLTRW